MNTFRISHIILNCSYQIESYQCKKETQFEFQEKTFKQPIQKTKWKSILRYIKSSLKYLNVLYDLQFEIREQRRQGVSVSYAEEYPL